MTPSPPNRGQSEDQVDEQPAAAPANVDVFTVGKFTRRDPVTGGIDAGVGVVADVGDGVLRVWPLGNYHVQVDLADFSPLTADDL